MDDNFRAIDGYPGYRISKDGEIQSCWSRHRRPAIMTDTWLTLRRVFCLGYPTANLARSGKKTACRIHRIVLETFDGPCPEGMVAYHGDGDRANSVLANLRWDTSKSNSDDTLLHGRRSRGSNANSKLDEVSVHEIRRLRAEGIPTRELAVVFGVSPKTIGTIANRRSWRHLPGDQGVHGLRNGPMSAGPIGWQGAAA